MNKLRGHYAIEGFIIMAIVIVLYGISFKYNLYYIFRYLDWVQHFMAGLGIGLIARAIFEKKWRWSIITVTVIAVSWEIFERIGHQYFPAYINYGGLLDTGVDIVCAILATSLVLLVTRE